MKNNKGFTLIELLATIALLAIIGVISFVSVTSIINKNKHNECNSLINNIRIATKEYISDNRYKETINTNINLKYLLDNNYLQGKVTNPYTKKELTEEELKSIHITIGLNDSKLPISINIDDETEIGVIRGCQDDL